MSSFQLHNAYSKKYAYVSKRIEKEPHSASCHRWRFHICSMMYECVNKQRRNPSRQEKGAAEKELVECLLSPYIKAVLRTSPVQLAEQPEKQSYFLYFSGQRTLEWTEWTNIAPVSSMYVLSRAQIDRCNSSIIRIYTRCLTYGQFRSQKNRFCKPF